LRTIVLHFIFEKDVSFKFSWIVKDLNLSTRKLGVIKDEIER